MFDVCGEKGVIMTPYLALAVCALLFISSLVYFKSTKKNKVEDTNKFKNVNKRFLKASEFGDNPERVLGYYEIEQIPGLLASHDYAIAKEICMELVAKGFLVSENAIISHPLHLTCATIHVLSKVDETKVGSINIYDTPKNLLGALEKFYEEKHQNNKNSDRRLHHLILRLPGIVIESDINLYSSSRPPLWMHFCAEVLTRFNPAYIDPSWIKNNPEAKRYINTLFEDD